MRNSSLIIDLDSSRHSVSWSSAWENGERRKEREAWCEERLPVPLICCLAQFVLLFFRSPFLRHPPTNWTPERGYWRLVSWITRVNAWLENWNHLSIAYSFFHLFLQLLRESEATSMRLTEQAKVLKEEIRRYATIATWLKNVFCTLIY